MSGIALRPETFAQSCPSCGMAAARARVFAEANFDLSRLDGFAFASRKLPEYMHFRLVECPECDLLFANPVPPLAAIERAYLEAGFDAGEESRYAARTYARLLEGIAGRFPDRSGALDIGTGDGAFLACLLEAGFTGVAGVEPSSAPIALADPRVRPLIRQGVFRLEDFEPGGYRLVTCFQTLEHVGDPRGLAESALALLKPGGAAFFIAHNRRALSARVLGRRSPIFDVEHLQLFSPRSARRLMEQSGFVDVAVRSIVNRYPLHYWLKLVPLPARWKRRVVEGCRGTRVGRLAVSVPAGNLAIVGYRRLEVPKPSRGVRFDLGDRA